MIWPDQLGSSDQYVPSSIFEISKKQIFWIIPFPDFENVPRTKIRNLSKRQNPPVGVFAVTTVCSPQTVRHVWASMSHFQANIHVIKPQSSFRRKLPFMIFMNFHEQSSLSWPKMRKSESRINPIYSSYDAVGLLNHPERWLRFPNHGSKIWFKILPHETVSFFVFDQSLQPSPMQKNHLFDLKRDLYAFCISINVWNYFQGPHIPHKARQDPIRLSIIWKPNKGPLKCNPSYL